jgi:predicted transcriptional regulator
LASFGGKMNEREKLAKELEKLIKRKGLTLKEVSDSTDVPISTLHRWICGELPIGILRFFRLLRFLRL